MDSQEIKLGHLSISYNELMKQSSLWSSGVELASRFLKKYKEPENAAKHLYNLDFKSIAAIGINELTRIDVNIDTVIKLQRMILTFATAYLAGYEYSDDIVRRFVESKFHDSSDESLQFDDTVDVYGRIGRGMAHVGITYVSYEHFRRSTYKFFFKKNKK